MNISKYKTKGMCYYSNDELLSYFKEIYEYRETGVLSGDKLRALSHFVYGDDYGEMLRKIEDYVLFEMACRFANIIEKKEYAELAGKNGGE